MRHVSLRLFSFFRCCCLCWLCSHLGNGLYFSGHPRIAPNRRSGTYLGFSLARLHIEFHWDNSAVVANLTSSTSRNPDAMHFIRLLTLAACKHHFSFYALLFLAALIRLLEPYPVLISRPLSPTPPSRQCYSNANSTRTSVSAGLQHLENTCYTTWQRIRVVRTVISTGRFCSLRISFQDSLPFRVRF